MSKRLLVLIGLLVTASMIISSCAPGAGPAPAAGGFECTDEIGCVTVGPSEPIHIAFWGILSGADATLGQDSVYGVQVAIEDAGGKVLGHDVKLTQEDAQCTPEGGAAAAAKLATDTSIVALIGSNCSDETVGGIAAITNAGLTTISPSNTRPNLTAPDRGPDYAGYLRTAHSDAFQGKTVAEFAFNQLKVTKAATIHDGSSYAEALQQVFADEFTNLGGTIVTQEAVAKTDTDMRAVLTTVAAAGPEMIYYPIFVAAGGFITAQAAEVSGLEDVILIASDGVFTPDFLEASGANVEGMYLSSPDFSAFQAGYNEFLAKYEALSGGPALSIFHAHAYDAANLIFAGIQKVAVQDADGTLHIGRKALRDALYTTQGFRGLTGVLTCGQFGDCGAPIIAVYQVEDANPATWDPGTNPKKVYP